MIAQCIDALTINEDSHSSNQEQHAELHLVRFFSLAKEDIHPTVCTAYIHAAPLCFSDSNHVLLIFVGNLRKKMCVSWFYFTLFTCAAEGSHEIVQTKGPAEVKRHSWGRWPQKWVTQKHQVCLDSQLTLTLADLHLQWADQWSTLWSTLFALSDYERGEKVKSSSDKALKRGSEIVLF